MSNFSHMKPTVHLHDIHIRTDLRPGDLGYLIYCQTKFYTDHYGYSLDFEYYVAAGICEFYQRYDPTLDRFWICEHDGRIIGCLLLMHREDRVAQLRYFFIDPAYQGIGLGRHLMNLYMDFLRRQGYRSSYLWTTHEQEVASALYTKYGFALTEEKPSTAFGRALWERRYELVL